jgi:hypothetical protein
MLRTKTDRDGFYQFENIPPGPYRVQLTVERLKAEHLFSSPATREATVPDEGGFVTNQDFLVAPGRG